jgi:RNA polymerase sigma factor (sigma-70 family)
MAMNKDSFPNDGSKTEGIVTESEISFFTKSGSSPTTANGSLASQLESRRPVVRTSPESGYVINHLYDRYRLDPNNREALDDLLQEIQDYAIRVLAKESASHNWPSARLISDDVIQKALLNIWKGLKTFRSESKFSTWCYGVVRRAAIDVSRRMPKGERQFLSWKGYAEYCGTAHAGCSGTAPGSDKSEEPLAERLRNAPFNKKDEDFDGRGFAARPLLPKSFLSQQENRLNADIDFRSILKGLNSIDSQIAELFFGYGYTAVETAQKFGKDIGRVGHKCSPGERWVQNRIARIRRSINAGEKRQVQLRRASCKAQNTRKLAA